MLNGRAVNNRVFKRFKVKNMKKSNFLILFSLSIRLLIRKYVTRLRRYTMERNEIIAGLLNRVGKFTTKTFIDRLAVQKIILIAQTKMKDFPFSYRYRLYISGPYSSELANDFYNIKDTALYGLTEFQDKDQDKKYGLFTELIKKHRDNKDILELVGTLFYLESKGIKNENLMNKLKSIKEGFSENCYIESGILFLEIREIFN